MLSPSDFVHIPYTSDLIQAGILYACRSLALDLVRASNLHMESLHHLVAEVAADLSLRRYLAQEHIAFKTLEAEPFARPERSEIILGGRPCHVINTLIARGPQPRRIAGSPAELLSAPASVPDAALTSEKWGYTDLLIFTFTLAAPKLARHVSSRAQADGNSDYLIYIFPEAWRNARLGGTIPGLVIQSPSDDEITLELGGRATNRSYMTEAVRLLPRQSAMTAEGLTSLAYLSTRQALTMMISVHNSKLNRTLHITPDRWSNLWVEGIEMLLAGYIEVGEFRRRARRLHPSGRPWESAHSTPPSLSLAIQDLLPLPQLVAWLRAIQDSS